jgi:hypothetical protein
MTGSASVADHFVEAGFSGRQGYLPFQWNSRRFHSLRVIVSGEKITGSISL